MPGKPIHALQGETVLWELYTHRQKASCSDNQDVDRSQSGLRILQTGPLSFMRCPWGPLACIPAGPAFVRPGHQFSKSHPSTRGNAGNLKILFQENPDAGDTFSAGKNKLWIGVRLPSGSCGEDQKP